MKVTLTLPVKEDPNYIAESLLAGKTTGRIAVICRRILDASDGGWSDGPSTLRFDTPLDLPSIEAVVAKVAPSANMLIG